MASTSIAYCNQIELNDDGFLFQDKARLLAKNAQENKIREAKGEEIIPDEEITKNIRPLPVPARLNSMIVSGQINTYAQHISQFCSQSLAKTYMTQTLQAAKTQPNQ